MAGSKGTILVTGANGGLGSAIAEQVASKPEFSGHHGVYTVRKAANAPELANSLARGASSHPHDVASLDLTNLENVRRVAEDVNTRVSSGQIPPIRALILVAGFLDFGKQTWTDDGLDTTFAANYLGHWLLTLLLLKSMDKDTGRIIVIGSQAHNPHDARNARSGIFADDKYKTLAPGDAAAFDAVAKGTWSAAAEDPGWRNGSRRYGAAKLFLIMMMHELQQRMSQDSALSNVCVLGVDPSAMVTGLQRLAPWFIRVVLFKAVFPLLLWWNPDNESVRPLARSAADVLEAAFGAVGENGELLPKDLYFDGREPFYTSEESRDAAKRALVWRETVRYAGLKEGDTSLNNIQ